MRYAESHLLAELPEQVRSLCAHDYLVLVQTLSIAASIPANEDAPRSNARYLAGRRSLNPRIADLARHIDAAAPLLKDWPTSLHRLVRDVQGRNPQPVGNTQLQRAFSTEVGRMLMYPMRGANGRPLTVLVTEARNFARYVLGITSKYRPTIVRPVASRVFKRLNVRQLKRELGSSIAVDRAYK